MKKILKNVLEKIIQIMYWYKFVLKHRSDYHIPFHIKLLYAFRGFTVNEYVWYNLKTMIIKIIYQIMKG